MLFFLSDFLSFEFFFSFFFFSFCVSLSLSSVVSFNGGLL